MESGCKEYQQLKLELDADIQNDKGSFTHQVGQPVQNMDTAELHS